VGVSQLHPLPKLRNLPVPAAALSPREPFSWSQWACFFSSVGSFKCLPIPNVFPTAALYHHFINLDQYFFSFFPQLVKLVEVGFECLWGAAMREAFASNPYFWVSPRPVQTSFLCAAWHLIPPPATSLVVPVELYPQKGFSIHFSGPSKHPLNLSNISGFLLLAPREKLCKPDTSTGGYFCCVFD